MAQSGKETSESEDYSESLAADCSVAAEGEGGGFSGSFSASAGMADFDRDISSTR